MMRIAEVPKKSVVRDGYWNLGEWNSVVLGARRSGNRQRLDFGV